MRPQSALQIAIRFAFLDGLPFVVVALATRQRDLDLRTTPNEIERQRYQREAALGHLALESFDLLVLDIEVFGGVEISDFPPESHFEIDGIESLQRAHAALAGANAVPDLGGSCKLMNRHMGASCMVPVPSFT